MTIRAGTCSVDITPELGCELVGYPALDTSLISTPLTMSGYVGRRSRAVAIHDPLLATVLVLDDGKTTVALIAIDTLYVSADFVRDIRAAASAVGVERVLVSASHTHSGPDLVGLWEWDQRIVNESKRRTVDAIERAFEDASPATVTVGVREIPSGTVNRAGLDQSVDRSMTVLGIWKRGVLAAACIVFACHPLAFDYRNAEVSADFVHYLRTHFEAAHPDTSILFFNGCAGNVNPEASPYGSGIDITGLGKSDPAYWGGELDAKRLGAYFGSHAVVAVAESDPLESPPLEAVKSDVRLPYRCQDEVRDFAAYLRIRSEHRSLLLGEREARTHVAVLRIGDIVFVGLPGEPFSALGMEVRARALELGARWGAVAGYTNDYVSYVLPETAYAVDRYERVATYLAPEAAGRMIDAAAEAVAKTFRTRIP
jgi:neutral ceramidase